MYVVGMRLNQFQSKRKGAINMAKIAGNINWQKRYSPQVRLPYTSHSHNAMGPIKKNNR